MRTPGSSLPDQIQSCLLRIAIAALVGLAARALSAEMAPSGRCGFAETQNRMPVVRPNQCASTRVRLLEYSPEARPLVPTLLVEEKSY